MKKLLALIATSAIVSPALAHTGGSHVDGLTAGLVHPFLGIDHLLAMMAVGLFAAAAMRDQVWMAPLAFVTAMTGGALLAWCGVVLPQVEGSIAVSVLVLGLMCVAAMRVPTGLALVLTAVFAVFHGFAHGTEATGGALAYVAGFSLATALLHGAGIALGLKVTAHRFVLPVLGGAIAAAGAVLLAS